MLHQNSRALATATTNIYNGLVHSGVMCNKYSNISLE